MSNMQETQVKFAEMLRRNLGDDWAGLHRDIARRFSPSLIPTPLVFHGVVNWLYCSPLGAALAWTLRKLALLPAKCARHVDFTFCIALHEGQIVKERVYDLQAGRFTFRSLFNGQPRLHEEFAGGLGMYLQLAVEQGALMFRDRGYFLRLGRWRLPLPRLFSVGHFELLHQNLDHRRFMVVIRIYHPLFGTLFYQRGIFTSGEHAA